MFQHIVPTFAFGEVGIPIPLRASGLNIAFCITAEPPLRIRPPMSIGGVTELNPC